MTVFDWLVRLGMNVRDDLLSAIKLMQAGDVKVAAELLGEVIADPELDDHSRATAYVWLAETRDDQHFKLDCLRRALECEPDNLQVRQVLDQLLAAKPAPPFDPVDRPPSPLGEKLLSLSKAPPVVGVSGGANGPGSGMFVSKQGLIATSSYVTGGTAKHTIVIDADHEVTGRVVRRYPQYDLALIETNVVVDEIGSVAPSAIVTHGEVIFAMENAGSKIRGQILVGGNQPSHWLATSFQPARVPNSGGNPIYDAKGNLLGLLTRNLDHKSGALLALSISQVTRLAAEALQARRLQTAAGCCNCCGCMTRARQYGGRYCETCGAILGDRNGSTLIPPDTTQLAQFYDGNESRPCPTCAALVGYYAGRCLRCGRNLIREQ